MSTICVTMKNIILMLIVFSSFSTYSNQENSLREKLWKAVKSYVKETDTYKVYNYGRKNVKKIKKVKKKINKKVNHSKKA